MKFSEFKSQHTTCMQFYFKRYGQIALYIDFNNHNPINNEWADLLILSLIKYLSVCQSSTLKKCYFCFHCFKVMASIFSDIWECLWTTFSYPLTIFLLLFINEFIGVIYLFGGLDFVYDINCEMFLIIILPLHFAYGVLYMIVFFVCR